MGNFLRKSVPRGKSSLDGGQQTSPLPSSGPFDLDEDTVGLDAHDLAFHMRAGGKLRPCCANELDLLLFFVFLTRTTNGKRFETNAARSSSKLHHPRTDRIADLQREGIALPYPKRLLVDERFPLAIEIEKDGVRSDLDNDTVHLFSHRETPLAFGSVGLCEKRSEGVVVAPMV